MFAGPSFNILEKRYGAGSPVAEYVAGHAFQAVTFSTAAEHIRMYGIKVIGSLVIDIPVPRYQVSPHLLCKNPACGAFQSPVAYAVAILIEVCSIVMHLCFMVVI